MKRTPLYWLSMISVLLGASSYGLLSSFIKKAYDGGFTLEQVTVHQTAIGMMLLWAIALLRPRRWSNPFRGPWVKMSAIGVFGLTLTTVLLNMSLERLDASLAIVLLFQFTWITILLDSIERRTWPGRYRLAAMVLVMAGTWLAAGILEDGISHFDPIGIMLGLASAVSYSLFIWLTGRIQSDVDPVIKSAVMTTAGLAVVLILYGKHSLAGANEGEMFGWGMVLGIVGQVIPTVLFNIGIPIVGSSVAALLGSMELPVAALAAWLLLGEQLSVWKVAGIALILIGIGIAELPSGRNQESSGRLEEKR